MDGKGPLGVPSGSRDSLILCRNSQGTEFRATLLRLSRFQAVFEVYNPFSVLQVSEVLSEFRIILNERLVYAGRAVVSNLVNTGILLVCEATLGDEWLDVDFFSPVSQLKRVRGEFAEFLKECDAIHRLLPDFKVVVADMQTFLMDLRRWLEQVEMGIRSEPGGSMTEMERQVIGELREPITPLMLEWFDRFDAVAQRIDEPMLPAHRAYTRRLLHPLVLCSPFVYRTFQKPLGYAGDYEMVNMILRDPCEGASLFAKIVNICFLNNPPAEAHRNRIAMLNEYLHAEAVRCRAAGRALRVLNLGCGPAREVVGFLADDPASEGVEFTLLDFNDETLEFARREIEAVRRGRRPGARVEYTRKSVNQILKEAARPGTAGSGLHDLVYCAGLFDYMSDRVCKRLMNQFYELLAPGGLLVATNVDAAKPFRHSMEFLLQWHLICRNSAQLESLRPDEAPVDSWRTRSDATGVNVFIEVRKPQDG